MSQYQIKYQRFQTTQDNRLKNLIKLCRDIPFWIEDKEEHTRLYKEKNKLCCINHYLSLPIKHGKQLPMFDYEIDIFNLLEYENKKYLWICKSTGIGASEFFLRYIVWKCVSNDLWKNCRVVIVTGPRIELAITLIDRIKKLFINKNINFDTNQNVVILNDVKIEAFPSHHVDTMRGLTNVKMIMIDEASFFPKNQQQEVRDATERYIAKSDPYIIMLSTPNRPDDMFASIGQEP